MSSSAGWTPRKSLELESRQGKARKIVELLTSWGDLTGTRILDIGTGAGVAAAALAGAAGPRGKVTAVDVQDMRLVREGFDFRLIDGLSLPFPDDSFDVVVSNQVLEHVGDEDRQLFHLREIRRVLTEKGYAYLAFPNRWAPIEPHFRVPLLTWLPGRWRSPYVRLTRRAGVYDCFPLSHAQATRLFRRAGFAFGEHTFEALQVMRRVEHGSAITRVLLRTPHWLFAALHPFVPTFIFKLRPAERG
jgi:SAM-dependent methyltransferase